MANYRVTDTELSTIASAIRLKGGTSEPLVFPSGFVSAISAIETQGTYISKVITENGEYDPASDNVDAFSHVTVSVPTSAPPVLVSKSISQNGTYNPVDDNADAYSQVVVNVSGGGGGSDGDVLIAMGLSFGSLSVSDATIIPYYCFYSNSTLTGFTGDSVTEIYASAFANCFNLQTVSFPECNLISTFAFVNCSSLRSISLPKCTYLSTNAFANCSYLSEAYLPECQTLGSSAFNNCRSLEKIVLGGSTVATMNQNTIANTAIAISTYLGHFGSIYVPASLVDAYKSANRWSTYADRITSIVDE